MNALTIHERHSGGVVARRSASAWVPDLVAAAGQRATDAPILFGRPDAIRVGIHVVGDSIDANRFQGVRRRVIFELPNLSLLSGGTSVSFSLNPTTSRFSFFS